MLIWNRCYHIGATARSTAASPHLPHIWRSLLPCPLTPTHLSRSHHLCWTDSSTAGCGSVDRRNEVVAGGGRQSLRSNVVQEWGINGGSVVIYRSMFASPIRFTFPLCRDFWRPCRGNLLLQVILPNRFLILLLSAESTIVSFYNIYSFCLPGCI
jgi:hypothetical protein